MPVLLKTSSLHFSPATHAITLASIAEKSHTASIFPSVAVKAVRMSCESTSATSPYITSTASALPVSTTLRTVSRSSRWFCGRF